MLEPGRAVMEPGLGQGLPQQRLDPCDVLVANTRAIVPGGRLVIVDFAPHAFEHMREAHQHRRLGFADSEIAGWLTEAGLKTSAPIALPPESEGLTVTIWIAERERLAQRSVA